MLESFDQLWTVPGCACAAPGSAAQVSRLKSRAGASRSVAGRMASTEREGEWKAAETAREGESRIYSPPRAWGAQAIFTPHPVNGAKRRGEQSHRRDFATQANPSGSGSPNDVRRG